MTSAKLAVPGLPSSNSGLPFTKQLVATIGSASQYSLGFNKPISILALAAGKNWTLVGPETPENK